MTTQIDSGFQQRLTELRSQSADIATATLDNGTGRPWMLPSGGDWEGDVLNIPDMSTPFNRDVPNQDYVDALLGNDGTAADCMAAKLQLDMVALIERAQRTRHMTPVRAAMHAAGRRKAHGDPQGLWIGCVLQWVQDIVTAGSSGS